MNVTRYLVTYGEPGTEAHRLHVPEGNLNYTAATAKKSHGALL